MIKQTAFAIAVIIVLTSPVFCQEYVIGGGDLLKITVYDNPDLATESRVSNEGKITFPSHWGSPGQRQHGNRARKKDRRTACGRVPRQAAGFGLSSKSIKSKKVSVLGEVAKPGLVNLRGKSTLLEVISDAGGITLNAGEALTIQRAGSGEKSNRRRHCRRGPEETF